MKIRVISLYFMIALMAESSVQAVVSQAPLSASEKLAAQNQRRAKQKAYTLALQKQEAQQAASAKLAKSTHATPDAFKVKKAIDAGNIAQLQALYKQNPGEFVLNGFLDKIGARFHHLNALMYAIFYNKDYNTIQTLLSFSLVKAHINVQNVDGDTAALLAVVGGTNFRENPTTFTQIDNYSDDEKVAILGLLYANGANFTIANNNGLSPMQAAVYLDNDMVINALNYLNSNVSSVYQSIEGAINLNDVDQLKQLYAKHFTIFSQQDFAVSGAYKLTVIMYAIWTGANYDILEALLALSPVKALINARDTNNSTAAFMTIETTELTDAEKVKIIDLLNKNGADFNIPNIYGTTPMQKAIDLNNVKLQNALKKIGITE